MSEENKWLINPGELGKYIDANFSKTLFRLETLDVYSSASDGEDFRRYLQGEPGPDMARKQPWLDHLKREVSEGKLTRRVHVVRSPLSDYVRYECEWGYAYNGGEWGEDIRILDLTEAPEPEPILWQDFWLIDDEKVVLMHYDADGALQKNEVIASEEVPRYCKVRDAVWDTATPFPDYWATHPQYWRINQKM